MKESGFQLIHVSKCDKEYLKVIKDIRHWQEERARVASFLWLRMAGKW